MPIQPPPPPTTGHPEIDREHAVLLGLLRQLEDVCALSPKPSAACTGCAPAQRLACEFSLIDVLGKVLGYTVDHFAFEEKAMRRLPESRERLAHCGAHIEDHERIAAELRDLALSIQSPDIIRSGRELQAVIRRWLGAHMLTFDVPFAKLLNPGGKPAQPVAPAQTAFSRLSRRAPRLLPV